MDKLLKEEREREIEKGKKRDFKCERKREREKVLQLAFVKRQTMKVGE